MRLVPATLALTGVIALVLAGVAGVGLAPLQVAEAIEALRLKESSEATTTTGAAFDAAAKSDALVVASAGTKVAMATTAKAATPVAKPVARTTRTAVSRSASTATTTGGWKTAKVSWYGPGFYGNTMAGGGTLTPTSMVVAHRSMAFGTRIEFSYKGKTCVAVVQDRGPYIAGRVFDLGPGTAQALGFGGVGTVSYRILGK
ncbi:MAG: septal ring lytic transglycosylase RlpA family protein [Coriobacteriia bacterium]|nr:septal ring lytic transglycosylase RlpA family protein [Coriobacteriia bacterium]